MPRRTDRRFARALKPFAEAYLLAFGAQQYFNGAYAPDEYEFHMRVMKAMLINRRNEPQVRKYFHSMDIRMGKMRPGGSLSSHNRKKRVDVQMAKYRDWPQEKDVPDEVTAVVPSQARQMGKSQALGAMYGSRPIQGSTTWWKSFNPRDVVRADEEYRTSVLNK